MDRRKFLKLTGATAGAGTMIGSASAYHVQDPYSEEFRPADSSNYTNSSRGAADIDWVVIHVTDGTWGSAVNWFQDPAADVSAHYVIRNSDGYTAQMVHHEDVAWHAAGFNNNSIGIEHEWYDGVTITDTMYQRSANIVNHLADQYNFPTDIYTDPCAAVNASGGIIGHTNAPKYGDCSNTSGKTCPQPGWDWNRFNDFLNGDCGDCGDDPGYSWPIYSSGDQEEAVYSIQYLLEQHGYALNYHDGIYGSEVESTVQQFQSDRGLTVDGVVGPNTWNELYVTVWDANNDPWWATYGAQHHLKYGQGYDITVGGYYGSETESATKDFQSNAGIIADGVIGHDTWQALMDIPN